MNLLKELRALFARSGTHTFIGKAIADVIDRDYDSTAPGEYNAILRQILPLLKRAAKLNSEAAKKTN